MKKNIVLIAILIFNYSPKFFSQLDSVYYQGPEQGSVASGLMMNTNDFLNKFISAPKPKNIPDPNILLVPTEPNYSISDSDLPPYYYSTDRSITSNNMTGNKQPILLDGWEAHRLGASIPPDPDFAVGPEYILTTVNSEFSIWDKQGNLMNKIDGDIWCGQVLPNPGSFDPQVIYDFYENRWFMLWDAKGQSVQSSFVISYSDDDDPNGIWYTYSLSASTNGSTSTNYWSDFPHIGFDEEAIYITSNQLPTGGGNYYSRIRIISKSELYESDGGTLTWRDIWNVKRPGQNSNGQDMMVTQPAISYTPGETGYFAWAAWFDNNYYVLLKISNPTTSPRLRGKVIPTQTYYDPPDANQLGGGTPLENAGAIKNKVILRDGLLYAVHGIGNSTAPNYSSIKYFVIDVNTASITEQAEFGAAGYFYMYPEITVDKDHNIAVTFSRSADTEYAGGYYAVKYNGDPPGLTESYILAEGKGNYDVTFGGTRNRFGDYLGIFLDPSNEYDVWMLPEYVPKTNVWGTYLGQIRMVPYRGAHIFTQSTELFFEPVEVGTSPVTKSVTIANYGEDDLVINSISSTAGPFTLLTILSYPVTLSTYDSLDIEIEFNPTTPAIYSELMSFDDNDPDFDGLVLNGTGYTINEAYTGVLYSSTGAIENGKVLKVDISSGAGTELGISNYEELSSLTISPTSNVLYGISTSSTQTELVRVNAMGGDAFTEYTLDIGNMSAIAFNSAGVLYASEIGGDIYTIDLSTGEYSYLTSVNGISSVLAMTIDEMTDEVWVAPNVVIGTKDKVYTLDLTTGDVTLVGQTGFGKVTNDMAIDENGILYGVVGGPGEEGELIQIDRTDGTGALVGNIGYQNVVGLGYSINGDPNSAEGTTEVLPEEYTLSQNYPNPFNPGTRIGYQIPKETSVKLIIYNSLGEAVRTLVNANQVAGSHSVRWDGRNNHGAILSSGIYIYRLITTEFDYSRKMILLR